MYYPYVLYDAVKNQIQSASNMTREEAKHLNKLIPTSNFSAPYLIWIHLMAFWQIQ